MMTDERIRQVCEQEPGLDEQDAAEVLTEVKRAREAEVRLVSALRGIITTGNAQTLAAHDAWNAARSLLAQYP